MAVEIAGVGAGDASMLPELLAQITLRRDIATLTADGAHDACCDAWNFFANDKKTLQSITTRKWAATIHN